MVILETVSCYICNSRQSSPWGEEGGFHMVKCDQCGLVYLNPRPDGHEIDEAARTGLHKFGGGVRNVVGYYSAKRVTAYRAKLIPLIDQMRHPQEPLRWLDIGAGFGELVEAVLQLCPRGSEVCGIEPCQPKVRKAQSKKLPVTAQPLSDISDRFTHVSLINVYSHLPNPVQFLGDLHRIMEPNAYLLLVTGNGGDIPRNEFPGSLYLPDHLSFAGERNIRSVLDDAKYDILTITPYAETASLDSMPLTFVKNIGRRLTGRSSIPLSFPRHSGYRSLWIVAQRRSKSLGGSETL